MDCSERFTTSIDNYDTVYPATIHVTTFFSLVKDGIGASHTFVVKQTSWLGGIVRAGKALPEPDALLVEKGGSRPSLQVL